MATKKTTTKNKSTKKPETTAKKTVDEMSENELVNILKENDTETLEKLEAENTPEILDEPVEMETAKKTNIEPKSVETVANEVPEPIEETVTEEVKEHEPKVEEVTVVEEKSPKPEQSNTNKTMRNVYGYDHFGMIYEY